MYRSYGDENTDWANIAAYTMLHREPNMNLEHKWEYEDGLMLNGMYDVYKVTKKSEYLHYIQDNINRLVDTKGNIYNYKHEDFNLDNINNGKILLDLYAETRNERYKLAADKLYNQLLDQPKTKEGSFWHKKIYPNQVWLDGIYMGSVFYAQYQKMFDIKNNFSDVEEQFLLAYKVTLDSKTGLCYHAYDESKKQSWANNITGQSKHFWLRSLGWFIMAMVDVQEFLPESINKNEINKNLNNLLKSIQKYADSKSNLWYQIPDESDRPMNYLEASGSLMILNAIAKSIRLKYISVSTWSPILEKGYKNAIKQFVSLTNEGFVNVNKIVEVGGLGGSNNRDGSFAYYMSEPVVANDHKGFGPFLMLTSEMKQR